MRSRGLTGLALLLALGALKPAAFSQVQSKRKELTRVEKELESTRREIEEYKRLEESMGKELQRLESTNAEAKKRIAQLEKNIRVAEEKRLELRSRLKALGQASGFWKSGLRSELRRYGGEIEMREESFGSRGLWKESLMRGAILEKAELLSGLQGLGRQTARDEAETRKKASDLLSASQKVQAEQKSRQNEYQAKKASIAQTREKEAAARRRAQELEESAKALTRLLRTLGKTRRYSKAGVAPSLDLPKNSLPWPAAGAVVRPFGRERSPELNTWVIRQGILLETGALAPVRAVREGQVIFSGPFRSYGQVVIIDHGSNFFSIYGELGEILTPKGALVRSQEVIAKAGPKGSLYLEMRRGTDALDPLVWLEKR